MDLMACCCSEGRARSSHLALPAQFWDPLPYLQCFCCSSHPVATLFNLLSNNRRKLFTLIYLWFCTFSPFLWLVFCWFSKLSSPARAAGECQRRCKEKAGRMHGSEQYLQREQQQQLIIKSALPVLSKLQS